METTGTHSKEVVSSPSPPPASPRLTPPPVSAPDCPTHHYLPSSPPSLCHAPTPFLILPSPTLIPLLHSPTPPLFQGDRVGWMDCEHQQKSTASPAHESRRSQRRVRGAWSPLEWVGDRVQAALGSP